MRIHSTRFGELEISEENIISFPYGLPGFLEEREFAYLACDETEGRESPFAFLQSLTEVNLAFIVVDPFAFFSDYEFDLNDEVAGELGLSKDNPPQILNIVSVPEKAEEMTANLLAPVIINRKDRTAVQLVLERSPYMTKHRLFPDGFSKTPTGEAK